MQLQITEAGVINLACSAGTRYLPTNPLLAVR